MNRPEIPKQEQSKSKRVFPRWTTPILLLLLFLLVHVIAPWGLSLFSTRHGWVNGRPGTWNLLAIIPVVTGITCTIWLIFSHYFASPHTFLEWQPGQTLITPGLYSFSRNPMYLFELIFWFGWALFYGSITVFMGFLLWVVLFDLVIVPLEERDLEARFGAGYREYKKNIPRWFGKP